MTPDIVDLPRAIQFALAPVFLLSGIAGLLSVMTGRLARIMDRGRALAEREGSVASPDAMPSSLEGRTLEQRRHLTSVAITATAIAALLVCVVIAELFVEVMLQMSLKWVISASFAGAMSALVVGLAFFLREVHLGMRTMRIAVHTDAGSRRVAPASLAHDARQG
jgi:uncharacterized protein DUF2721